MKQSLTLPFIANELFPQYAQKLLVTSTESEARARELRATISKVRQDEQQDGNILRQLYDLTNRLHLAAKDAQNLMERSLELSRPFVPVVEIAYPCPEADAARLAAQRLHTAVSGARAALGGRLDDPDWVPPPGRLGGRKEEAVVAEGAADTLARLQRRLAGVAGKHKTGNWQPLPHQEVLGASVSPLVLCTIAVCNGSSNMTAGRVRHGRCQSCSRAHRGRSGRSSSGSSSSRSSSSSRHSTEFRPSMSVAPPHVEPQHLWFMLWREFL